MSACEQIMRHQSLCGDISSRQSKEHVQLRFVVQKIARILRIVAQTGANLAVWSGN